MYFFEPAKKIGVKLFISQKKLRTLRHKLLQILMESMKKLLSFILFVLAVYGLQAGTKVGRFECCMPAF